MPCCWGMLLSWLELDRVALRPKPPLLVSTWDIRDIVMPARPPNSGRSLGLQSPSPSWTTTTSPQYELTIASRSARAALVTCLSSGETAGAPAPAQSATAITTQTRQYKPANGDSVVVTALTHRKQTHTPGHGEVTQ